MSTPTAVRDRSMAPFLSEGNRRQLFAWGKGANLSLLLV